MRADPNAPSRKWWHWAIVGCADVVGRAIGCVPAVGALGVGGAAVVGAACAASGLAFNMTNPKSK